MIGEEEEVTSNEGPMCPYCKSIFVPDEKFYYNESGYDLTCDACDHVFHVEVSTDTNWTSTQVK